ncbi:hypothetical protein C8R46DRAFT_1092435 [Mycena filopes]|nr:hypothetical protein C8R46DRAFT_1092435 [Mycena filopes]
MREGVESRARAVSHPSFYSIFYFLLICFGGERVQDVVVVVVILLPRPSFIIHSILFTASTHTNQRY